MGVNATLDVLKIRVAVSRAFEHRCYHGLTIRTRWRHASQTRNTSTGIRPSITAQKPNDDTTTIPRKKSADANMSAAVGRMRCPMIIPPFEKTLNEDDRRDCVNEPWMRHMAAAKTVEARLTKHSALSLPLLVLTGRGWGERLSAPRDLHASLDLAVELDGEFAADLHHRQAHFGAVDQARAPQPVLRRRRTGLGEQQARQVRDRLPARQRRIVIAALQLGMDGRKRRGLEVG